MHSFILFLLFLICISLSFCVRCKEVLGIENLEEKAAATTPAITSYSPRDPNIQRYYDNYKVYLKENTNTTYDEYVGREILKKDDSASAYIRGRIPDPNNKSVNEKIKEREDLISYFINLFKKNSRT